MEGKRVIQSLSIKNLLSYGSEGVELELQPLNVLIGPNASGKSNFLKVFRLLQALPTNVSVPIIAEGGISDWLWKGAEKSTLAELCSSLNIGDEETLRHDIQIGVSAHKIRVVDEEINWLLQIQGRTDTIPFYSYKYYNPKIATALHEANVQTYTNLFPIAQHEFSDLQSILAQRTDPVNYPDLYRLANIYKQIAMYADVNFGRNTPARQPQKADLDSTYLFEDGSNLALVINDLQNRPGVMRDIIARFKRFNPRVQDIITRVSYGTVQIFIEEEGLQQTLPATRLSDGTLRYLFLLVLLCHPEPPPIICIEEPELGLHPDMIRSIAELLLEASQRTQIILTTHSDLLVSALSETPEAIVICEHDGDSSTLRRLEPDKLNLWLEKYSLGELWLKGEIGGTRW